MVVMTADGHAWSANGISVPMAAVLMTGEDNIAVYRVNDKVAELVAIRPLKMTSSNLIIEQGLQAGDQIVTEGIAKLYDGASVEIVQ